MSNQVFNRFLNKYKSSKNDLQYYKRMMISIFIILYRTGLRVGEVLKIKLKDIEISDEFWIDIRENNKGDNKTYSSLRRIPLGILLKKEEHIF
ncbi:MAG: tyrosine-type recombinase/integrase [Gammaproteobacteria bacterium]